MEDKYTTIELDESADSNSDLNPIVDWANSYAPTYLPEGFQIAKESETDTFKSITIVNKEGLFIKYQQFIQSASINFDTENAASIENIQIGDNDATLIVKDSLISIIWNQDHAYFVISSQLGRDETIKFAESVKFIR